MKVWTPDTGAVDWTPEQGCFDCGNQVTRVTNKRSPKSPDYFCDACKKGIWLQKTKPVLPSRPVGDRPNPQTGAILKQLQEINAGIKKLVELQGGKDDIGIPPAEGEDVPWPEDPQPEVRPEL